MEGGSASGSAELELELSAIPDGAEDGVLGSTRFETPSIGSDREVAATLAVPAYVLLPPSWARTEQKRVITTRVVKMTNEFLMSLSPGLLWRTFEQRVFPQKPHG
jgi:hypothetical protein